MPVLGLCSGGMETRCSMPDRALCFAHTPAFPLRRLLIISRSLHVSDQTLLLTQLLKTPNHLLNGLTRTHLHFEHSILLKTVPGFKHTQPRDVYILVVKRESIKLTGGESIFKCKNCRLGYLMDFRLLGRMVRVLWDLTLHRMSPEWRKMLEAGGEYG